MSYINRVIVAGRLTRDPELRRTSSGKSVVDLGLALSDPAQKGGENGNGGVCFLDVVAWERQAEVCAEYLRKGAPVMVEGSLQQHEWKGKDGEPRRKLRIRADRVQFLDNGRRRPAETREQESGGESRPARAAVAASNRPEQEE